MLKGCESESKGRFSSYVIAPKFRREVPIAFHSGFGLAHRHPASRADAQSRRGATAADAIMPFHRDPDGWPRPDLPDKRDDLARRDRRILACSRAPAALSYFTTGSRMNDAASGAL